MSTWLVVGGTGMLGQDVVTQLRAAEQDVVVAGSADVDIRDEAAVQTYVAANAPAVIVNCAAHTAVDDAESDEQGAFALNAIGARNVARAAQAGGAELVHISTDYVFDGTASAPYRVDEVQNPRSAYGRTKAAGEWAVRTEHPDARIVRTAWLYGAGGGNFVHTMLKLAETKPTLDVVDDQVGQPTWTRDVADFVIELVRSQAPGGYFHATSEGRATWRELAQEAYRLAGLDPARIRPTTTSAFPRPAPRPAFSVLDHPVDAPVIGNWRERLRVSGLAQQPTSAA